MTQIILIGSSEPGRVQVSYAANPFLASCSHTRFSVVGHYGCSIADRSCKVEMSFSVAAKAVHAA